MRRAWGYLVGQQDENVEQLKKDDEDKSEGYESSGGNVSYSNGNEEKGDNFIFKIDIQSEELVKELEVEPRCVQKHEDRDSDVSPPNMKSVEEQVVDDDQLERQNSEGDNEKESGDDDTEQSKIEDDNASADKVDSDEDLESIGANERDDKSEKNKSCESSESSGNLETKFKVDEDKSTLNGSSEFTRPMEENKFAHSNKGAEDINQEASVKEDNGETNVNDELEVNDVKGEFQSDNENDGTKESKEVEGSISDCEEDEEWDEDDPFGFEADRDQEVFLETFRLGIDEEEQNMLKRKEFGTQDVDSPLNSTSTTFHRTSVNNSIERLEKDHPNQALFDILDRNFDDLDSFHVPSLNRLVTSDEIKVFFVAFVVVFTPPKAFEFAHKYNNDIDTQELASSISKDEVSANLEMRSKRRWLFKREKGLESKGEGIGGRLIQRNVDEIDEKQPNNAAADNHTFIHVPYEAVYALWVQVAKNLGIIKSIEEEVESMEVIMNHVQESVLEMGLLEIEFRKKKLDCHQFKEKDESSSISVDSNKSDTTWKEDSKFYMIRHAINEQYGLSLAKSEKADLKHHVSIWKKGWFEAVAKVHNEISVNIDEYQMMMTPYLHTTASLYLKAKDVLLNESFLQKRLESLGILQCVTAHLSDVYSLLNSKGAAESGNFPDAESVCVEICSMLRSKIETSIDNLQNQENNIDQTAPFNQSQMKLVVESGKALHLIALLFGSLGYVTKELKYHIESIKVKEYWVKASSDSAISSISLSDSYNCMGVAYDNIGDFDEAITCYDRALTTRRSLLGNNHLKVAETCHSMGSLLCEQNELDSAEMLLEEALRIRKYFLSEKDTLVADTEQWLGNVMRETGRLDEALEYFKSALVSKKANVGNDHEDVADAMHNMAIILDDMQKHELSISCYQEALRIRELIYGRNNLMVADTLLCLGNVYKSMSRHLKAIHHIKESIDIREKILAPYDELNDSSLIMCMGDLPDELLAQQKGLIDCYIEMNPLLEIIDTKRSNEGDSFNINLSQSECFLKMGNIYSTMRCWDDAYDRYQGALDLRNEFDPELQLKIGQVCVRRGEFDVGKEILVDSIKDIAAHCTNGSIVHYSLLYTLGVIYFNLSQYDLALSSFNQSLHMLKDYNMPIYQGNTHHWIGRSYFEKQNYKKATTSILSSLKIYNENRMNVREQIILRTLHLLGNTHFKNKQIKLALKCYEEEISLNQKSMIDASLNDDCLSEAHYCAGIIHVKKGSLQDASKYLETALETRKRFQGEENKKVAKILHKLGMIYLEMNEYEKAKEKLICAYNLCYKIQGPHDEYTATIEFKVGQTLDCLNELEQAMVHYKQCLETRQSLTSQHNEEIAIVLFHMGKNASSRLRFDEAIEHLEKALDIRRKVHSMEHDLIAIVLYELGKSYNNNKSIDKSLLCYREALRIWKLLSNDLQAAQASFAIAEIFETDEKVDLAVKNYLECIALSSNLDHVQLHLIHCRLGKLFERSDNLEKSALHFESSRQCIKGNNNEDEKIIDTLHSLSRVYSKMKRYNDALQCNKDLVSLQSDSSSLASVFHSMGETYNALGQLDEAQEYLKKSLSIHKTIRDPDVLSMARTLIIVAKVNESANDRQSAYDNLVEALRIFKLKRETESTIETLDSLAKINESLQQLDEAKECFEECIALKKELFGEYHLSLSVSLHNFGCLYKKISDFSGSLEVFKSALRIRKQELGLDHEDTISTIMEIGELYFLQEHYDASLRCFDQVLPILDKMNNSACKKFSCNHFTGVIHYKTNRFTSAVTFLQQAIQCEDSDISPSISIHDTVYYLGSALQQTHKHSEAIQFLRKAVDIREIEFGVNSRQYVESIAALGECFYNTGAFDEALIRLSKALGALKAMKSKDDLLSAQIQICLAKIFAERESYDDAIKLLDSSMELFEDSDCDCQHKIATIHLLKGKFYAKQEGALNQAMGEFKRCIDLRKEHSRDIDSESVAEVLMEVGVVLLDKNELNSSLNCFLEAFKIRKRLLGQGRNVALSACSVGGVLQRLQRYDEAMDFFKDARNMLSTNDDSYSVDMGRLEFGVGLTHKDCKRNDEALKSFRIAIDFLKGQNDEDCFPDCHYHLSMLLSEKGVDKNTMTSLLEALELLRGNNEKNKSKIADILTRLGDIHEKKSQEREAMSMYLEAAQLYEDKSKHVEHATCLLLIGNLYMKSDKLDKSFPIYQKAYQIHKMNPLDDIDASALLFGLGFIYNQRSKHEEAMGVLKNSLKIRLKLLGKNSLEVARTCEQLGTALVSLSRYEDALKACTMALDVYKNELGENHICCARVMLDIGTIYCNKENYDLSLVQLEACLQFFKKECGEASEEVANVLLRIGQIHDLRVDHDEAMKCMTQALEIRTEMYGRNDTRVAETMLNIARVLQDWGDVDEAMDCFKNALQIYMQQNEDYLSAEVYIEIGNMYIEQHEHKQALGAYNKALSIFKNEIGEKSNEVGNTLRNIGAAYDALNDISMSFKYYSDALKILSHNLGKEDLGVALVLNNLGINLARKNEYSKAFQFCKEALLIRRKLLPDGHLDIADTLFNIANILDDKGDQDEQALKFYSEALLNYKSNFGDDNEDVANCCKNIGLIYMRSGESANALKKISAALRIFRLKQGDNNIEVASLLYNLGRLFGKQARYDKALACFSECLKIRSDILGDQHEESIATKRFVDAIQRKISGGR